MQNPETGHQWSSGSSPRVSLKQRVNLRRVAKCKLLRQFRLESGQEKCILRKTGQAQVRKVDAKRYGIIVLKALLGFNYVILNYVKKNTTLRRKMNNERKKRFNTQGASTNETKVPMQVRCRPSRKFIQWIVCFFNSYPLDSDLLSVIQHSNNRGQDTKWLGHEAPLLIENVWEWEKKRYAIKENPLEE